MTTQAKTMQERVDHYVNDDPCHCPICGSENLQAGSLEVDEWGGATQHIECLSCGEEYHDVYELVGIRGEGGDMYYATNDLLTDLEFLVAAAEKEPGMAIYSAHIRRARKTIEKVKGG